MKFYSIAVFVLAIAASWSPLHDVKAATNETASSDHIIVTISVDGLAAFYYDDPKAEMPTLRELAAKGARATMMKASTPTVTWPNHTTLVTGVSPAQHGVVGNNYLDRTTGKTVALIGDPQFDKDQAVKVPTVYDLAKAGGLKTAAIRWPATRNAKTLDWTIPDMKTAEAASNYSTSALLAECEQADLHIASDYATNGDAFSTRVFIHILHAHHPNLAFLHISEVDHIQHLNGPQTPEAYDAIKAADRHVREVWDELKRDYAGRATLLIVSDHGFSSIKETILPNVVLRQAGVVPTTVKKNKAPVQVVVQGGSLMVYVRDDAHRADLLAKVRETFSGLRGVAKVVGIDQFKDYGVADPKNDPHAPDLIIFAQDGFAFGNTASGDTPFINKLERAGTHGHDPNLPIMHATFIAWGEGIKKGVTLSEISNTSVAPTIARLLHLTIPNAEGQPLSEALAE